jgi:D-glycero-D-manno-heptose 1,7-bisphosphate phosphatase
MMKFTTAFLDRDGTLNVKPPDGSYITRAEDLMALPGALAAVRRLNDAGIYVVLVSNQRGVALGLLSPAGLDAVTDRLCLLLARAGAHLDAVYVCPHREASCGCRKPAPGMLLRAAREHERVNLAQAVTIGDAESDVAAGTAAGTATVRLSRPLVRSAADHVAPDLTAAVDWMLSPDRPVALARRCRPK